MPDDDALTTTIDPPAETPDDPEGPPAEPAPKRMKFPTALTVLAIVLGVVWLASFFIPSGVYDLDDTGGPVPGSYHELPECSDVPEGQPCVDKSLMSQFKLLWRSPPNGL